MRKILLAIVALMASLSAFAGDLDIFLKGGVSISKFNLEESENRAGVAAGFGGKFHFGESHFFIMPEVLYVQKGQENQVKINENSYISPVMMHMIEVPLLFGGQYNIAGLSSLSIAFGVGPYVSYDFRFHEYTESMKYVMHDNKLKGISHGDIGLALNFEVHYKSLFVFYDYDLGLRDVTSGHYGLANSLCHRNMRIGAGYTFPTMKVDKQRKKPQM